jgi:large subunit ribosomal protein L25
MEFAELKVEKRKEIGKNEVRKLRAAGKIPAVIYGDGKNAVSLTVDSKAVRTILQKDGINVIFKLEGLDKTKTAMVKDIQRHPVKDAFVHIDFKIIALNEAIEAAVPLEIIGSAVGVRDGGVLQQSMREINIKALPNDIPEKIELDVSELNVGESLHISDISSSKNVEILNDAEEQVVSVLAPTEIKEEAAPAEGEEVTIEAKTPPEEEQQGE